jgi:hypothetical protein
MPKPDENQEVKIIKARRKNEQDGTDELNKRLTGFCLQSESNDAYLLESA